MINCLCNSQLLMACLNVTDCRLNCVLWVKGESSNRVKVNSIAMGKDYCYLNESLNKKVWFHPTYLINLYPVLQHVLATCNICGHCFSLSFFLFFRQAIGSCSSFITCAGFYSISINVLKPIDKLKISPWFFVIDTILCGAPLSDLYIAIHA